VIIEAKNQRDPATGLGFQPEESRLSEAARAKLRRLQELKDADQWRTVWVVGEDKKPWPVFIRVGGTNKAGDAGIRDLTFVEVLEWDPELVPAPQPGKPGTYPEVIIAAPQARSGLFNTPNLKF
jgi:hypothetical protein